MVTRVLILTVLAMLAFAGNSLLCRVALKGTGIDAASFSTIRILAGALVLAAIVRFRAGRGSISGSWPAALALAAYSVTFSFAYRNLTAATGALILFGAVQVTMIASGLWRGERLRARQVAGLVLALAGLVALVLPGLSAPPLLDCALMLSAGIAWGVYTLFGKGHGDPLAVTAGNFARASLLALIISMVALPSLSFDGRGALYALLSGAVTSGLGYVIWYSALRGLTVTTASVAQLSVPVIAAMGGVVLLDEPLTLRIVVASAVILGGIALVVVRAAPFRAP